MARTLFQLRTDIAAQLSHFYTDADVNRFINEGFVELAKLFRPTKEDTSLATVAGQRLYNLPADVVELLQVRMTRTNGDVVRLSNLNTDSIAWPNLTGEPSGWYPDGATVVSNARRLRMGLYPVPTSDYNGLTLTCEYVYRPAELSADADVPSVIPDELHHVLGWYGVWRVAEDDSDAPSTVAERFRRYYERAYSEIEGEYADEHDDTNPVVRNVMQLSE